MTIEQLAKQYVKHLKRLNELENAVNAVELEMDKVEKQLLEQFQQSGLESLKVDGVNLHLRRDVYASAWGEKAGLVEALKQTDFAPLIEESFNHNALSSWVRDNARKDGRELSNLSPKEIIEAQPSECREVLKVSEKFSIRSTIK